MNYSGRFSGIDAITGRMSGVTVCEVGPAQGHYAFLDRDGAVLGVGGAGDAGQFPGTAKKLPLAMDQKSLQSVVDAGQRAGNGSGKVRSREDHDDSVSARAGIAQNFKLQGDKVTCDLSLLDAYRNRALVLETAQKSPDLLGLSLDCKFEAEIKGDVAYMRVNEIDALDIVGKGALTPAGLL